MPDAEICGARDAWSKRDGSIDCASATQAKMCTVASWRRDCIKNARNKDLFKLADAPGCGRCNRVHEEG